MQNYYKWAIQATTVVSLIGYLITAKKKIKKNTLMCKIKGRVPSVNTWKDRNPSYWQHLAEVSVKGQKKKEGKKGIKDTRGNGQREEKEKHGTKEKQKTTKKPKNTNPYEKN